MDRREQFSKVRGLFEQNLPIFSALGDATRQKLVMLILDGQQRSVHELASLVGLSRPTVSHHLKILKDVGIVTEQKVGTKTIYVSGASQYIASVDALIQAIKTLKSCKEE
jgi:DNA-binding transcriptional ArsR family regulator